MADKQKCKCVTHVLTKRAVDSMAEQSILPSRKRVVLGDLTNLKCADLGFKSKRKNKISVKSVSVDNLEEVESGYEVRKLCASSFSTIYDYLLEKEKIYRPSSDYLEKVQQDVKPFMRGILIDWLVGVSEEYKLVVDTVFLTVSCIDRFLSKYPINKNKLQLLGISAMLVASKYEEICPPSMEDFCYMTDNSYTKAEVLKMEGELLRGVNNVIGNPTIKTFLGRFNMISQESYKIKSVNLEKPILKLEYLGSYLAELSLLEYSCIKFSPSLVAACVIFLARFILRPKRNPWCLRLEQHTGYKPSHLKECVLIIHELTFSVKKSPLEAVREKYNSEKFKFVSSLVAPTSIPVAYLEDLF